MNPDKLDQIRHDALMDEYRSSIKNGIREWFLRHYEDPAQSTPYDSSEGGYLYQWGGPYEARDVLHGQFRGEAEEDLIDEVADELELISHEWERIPTFEDIDPDDIGSGFYSRFCTTVASIRLELEREELASSPFLSSLLYAYTITSLEAYLSDAFITCIKNPKYFRAFIESDPELKGEKLTVSEIYKKMETLQADALKRIQSIVFHRLEIVQRMYSDTLGVEFPPGMRELIPAVLKRHDIIHRGCKNKEGLEFEISKGEVEALIDAVGKFVSALDEKLRKIT